LSLKGVSNCRQTKEINSVQGRVLSHGEDETGNRYLLLEGTVGRGYDLRYTPELDDARSRGDPAANTFVEIRKTLDESRKRRITVMNLGDADALLEEREHFRPIAKRLLRQDIIPLGDERWNGWLGNYHEKFEQPWKGCLHQDQIARTVRRPRKVRRGMPKSR